MRDACRIFPLKVFVCEFYNNDEQIDKPTKTVYFTNRFELGHSSVYDKLKIVNQILTSTNPDHLLEMQKNAEEQSKN